MLDERQKKLAAAVLAVREGRLTATEAAALVKDTAAKAEDFFKGTGDARQLDDDRMLEAALCGAGLSSEETKLFATADNDRADQIARKTLYNVAPTMPPANSATERPSTTRLRRPSRITERERYSIKREFARGGQGRIMIARDNVVGREVALKELLPELQEQEGKGTPATAAQETIGVVERFLREAKVTGQLEHPNVVPVYEIGRQESGSLYYTMKFVRGQTMAERLRDIDRLQLPKEKKLALRLKLLEAFQGICNAVAFAHSRGVIHRDLKPQNIMVGDFGETVLLDWGLARVKGQDDKIGKQLTLVATNMLSESLMKQNADGLTVDGTVFGTPHYMPPEQARADLKEIDEQSDVYSLGAILYEILTGVPPYDGPTAGFILQQVMSGPPRKIKERELQSPPDLAALCEFAMAHDKGRRMKTALQLAAEIQSYRDGGQLKVYRYGAFEQARRAMLRHRGAVVSAIVMLLLLIGGGATFFLIIINEKAQAEELQLAAEADRDQTNNSLRKAQQARDAQKLLETRQAEDRTARKKAREAEIRSLRDAIAGMRVEPLMKDLAARVAQYEDIEDRGKHIEVPPADRASNANLLMSALGFFAAQESLLSLQVSGDESPDSLLAAELARQRDTLAQTRLLAARLATYNSDFGQAELLLAGTEADESRISAARKAINRTRDTMLGVQRTNIRAALSDVEQGLLRAGRTGPGLHEYIERLKGYRERQTVELLTAALAPITARAKAKGAQWARSDIDTGILACGVLGRLELPTETAPPLLELLLAHPPAPLLLACAQALCETRSPAASVPLARFARGTGFDLWRQLEPGMAQLPVVESLRRGADLDSCLDLAVLLLSRADARGALKACDQALALDSASAEAHLLRGIALERTGNQEGALENMKSAITLAPGNPRMRVARGELLARQGLHRQAILDYSGALAGERDYAAALIRRGESRLAIYEYDDAASDFARAFESDAWRLDALTGLASVHEAKRDLKSAHQVFARLLETDPYYQDAWAKRGMMNRANGLQREAIHDLTRALELNPRDWRCWNTRAQSHAVLEEWASAVNDADMALSLDPNDVASLLVRAETILRIAENDASRKKALADLRRASQLSPEDATCWYLLAETARQLKFWDESAAAAGRVRRLLPFGATREMKVFPEDVWRMELDAQAALAVSASSSDLSARLLKCRGLANLASARDLQSARSALELLHQLGSEGTLDQASRAHLAAVARKLALNLSTDGFAADALAALAVADNLKLLRSEDCYLAARISVKLGAQRRDARVQLLGSDDGKRAQLEADANGKPQDDRDRLKQEAHTQALAWLSRAAQLGLGDSARVQNEAEFLALRSLAQWPAVLKQINDVATDPAIQAALKARLPVPVLHVTWTAEGGQAKARGMRPRDVIHSINDTAISSFEELRAALAKQTAPYALKLRRYRLDDAGNFVQQLESGKPKFDASGAPIWIFEELVIDFQPGQLGVRAEEGIVPRELIVP